ncbi:MAG: recombinase family protein [Myxococcota bacterium]|jgi:DNA invertase Pin-like site-specific DNA recombinase
MKTNKRAVAYLRDIDLRCDDVITRDYQRKAIVSYAADNGVDVVAWFEDDINSDKEPLERPGVKAMLAYNGPCDLVLTERVWALSRSMEALDRLFGELDRRAIVFDAATTMWDCTSQRVRHRFYPALRELRHVEPAVVAAPEQGTMNGIRKFFDNLFGHRHAHA